MNRNKHQRRNAKIAATRLARCNVGVELLSREADKKVQQKCTEIADALADAAIHGNASATRLLVDLADSADWVQNEAVVQGVLEVVQGWRKEPQFDDGEHKEMPAGVIAPQIASVSTPDDARATTYVN